MIQHTSQEIPLRPFCIGHRGAAGHAPENTLLSVEKALDLGADWIEVDVHAVHGELLVIHDRTLNRTTNGRGRLSENAFAHIRSLNAGHGQRIPLLSEVADLIRDRAGLHIELKGGCSAIPVGKFVQKLMDRGWTHQVIVSSFQHSQLKLLKRGFPEVGIGLLFAFPRKGYTGRAMALKASSVHLPWQFTTKALVDEAHHQELSVLIYTVNRKSVLRRLVQWGVDGFFTDFPERVIEVKREFNLLT
ncbi:glycerophosphodiester phosphodiesterase [bacterium]|nr:glycerophosphodiester phosphodiesterase [bacterium]